MERSTPRLILLPWTDKWADDFALLCADARVMEHILGGKTLVRDEANSRSRKYSEWWRSFGHGPWAALERSSGEFVGRIGLNLLEDWSGRDKWEVAWMLRPEYWGRGLATEGAVAAIEFGFSATDLERIISVTLPNNLASRRVMEKAGLVYQGTLEWRGAEVVWYAIDKPGPPP
jgi:ribosomal-protein-alanine N-acetyltransferase